MQINLKAFLRKKNQILSVELLPSPNPTCVKEGTLPSDYDHGDQVELNKQEYSNESLKDIIIIKITFLL